MLFCCCPGPVAPEEPVAELSAELEADLSERVKAERLAKAKSAEQAQFSRKPRGREHGFAQMLDEDEDTAGDWEREASASVAKASAEAANTAGGAAAVAAALGGSAGAAVGVAPVAARAAGEAPSAPRRAREPTHLERGARASHSEFVECDEQRARLRLEVRRTGES